MLSGHEHNYERFAPQDPDRHGRPGHGASGSSWSAPAAGATIRFDRPLPNSEVRERDTYGVLKLTLHADGYDWQFLPVDRGSFTDAGSGLCH